jgi:hypothetical protein
MNTTALQDKSLGKLIKEESEITVSSGNIIVIINAEKVIDWVAGEFSPEEVFSDTNLARWANNNGYVLEEEQ